MIRNQHSHAGVRGTAFALVVAAALTSVGCGTPPSVAPLLAVAERAMREEEARQQEDLSRDLQHVAQVRDSLATAFEKDLRQTPQLTADWVRDAATVYAAAREELMRHEMQLRATRAQRADNLRAAREALQRAADMLDTQDALLHRTVGTTGWSLMQTTDDTAP